MKIIFNYFYTMLRVFNAGRKFYDRITKVCDIYRKLKESNKNIFTILDFIITIVNILRILKFLLS